MNKGIFIYLLIIKCLMIYNSKTKLVLEVKGNSDYLNFYYMTYHWVRKNKNKFLFWIQHHR